MTTVCFIQPYIFPYLPYFQLAHSVDEFYVLDNVQYIRRGWMNRNFIAGNKQKIPFTIPVQRGNRSDLISEKLLSDQFEPAMMKLKSSFLHNYSTACNKDEVIEIIEKLISQRHGNFLSLSISSLEEIFKLLGLDKKIRLSSTVSIDTELTGQDRIIALCRKVHADHYVNPAGGRDLYSKEVFSDNEIELKFINSELSTNSVVEGLNFDPHLSVLDLIAKVPKNNFETYLQSYELVD